MPAADVAGLPREKLELKAEEKELLARELERTISAQKSPLIAEMISENRENIRGVIESVNQKTREGFGGMLADGRELTCEWIRSDHFGKSTWDRGVTASGVTTFISGSTAENEGFIIFGWMNQQEKPPTNQLKFYKGTEETPVVSLPFRAREAYDATETPIVKQKKPLLIGPEVRYEVDDKRTVSGADSLQPLGFYIQTAEDAWSL